MVSLAKNYKDFSLATSSSIASSGVDAPAVMPMRCLPASQESFTSSATYHYHKLAFLGQSHSSFLVSLRYLAQSINDAHFFSFRTKHTYKLSGEFDKGKSGLGCLGDNTQAMW